MTTVFVGDVGTEIVLDCGVNISTATVRQIVVRKGGTKVTWTAVADGANGIKYVTQDGDLDVAGTWTLQAYIEMPGWKGRGVPAQLLVSKVL